MICSSCPIPCPIEQLLDTRDRVIIQGFKDETTGEIRWIVDLMTIDAEGHGSTERLMDSMKIAERQTVEDIAARI